MILGPIACLGSSAGAVPDRPDETRENCGGSCSEERP